MTLRHQSLQIAVPVAALFSLSPSMDGNHGFSSSVYVGLKRSRHTYPKEALPVALQSEIPWRNWAAAQGVFAALLERQLESFAQLDLFTS